MSTPPGPAGPAANELRIHGVGGSPGAALLGHFDPALAPVNAALSTGPVTIRECEDELGGLVVGFDWGELTSGAKAPAAWVFLLPFTLVNVAGWAHTSAGARLAPLWSGLTRALVGVAGWLLTATWALWIADVVIAYGAYQWAPRATGEVEDLSLLPWGLWQVDLDEQGVRRIATVVGALAVLAVIAVVAVLAGRTRRAVQEPALHDERGGGAAPAFSRSDGPFGEAFFSKRPGWAASTAMHLVIAVAMLAVVVGQAWAAAGRHEAPTMAPVDATVALVAGLNVAVLVLLVLCSWFLPWLASLGQTVASGQRRPNGVTAAAAVMATALTNAFFSGAVLWVVNYLEAHPKLDTDMETGRDLVILDAYFWVVIAWALIGLAVLALRRRYRSQPDAGAQPVPPVWVGRVRGAEGTAAVIHKADHLLEAAALAFLAVGLIVAGRRLDPQGWKVWEWDVDGTSATGALYSAAAWALPSAVVFVVLQVRRAASDNRLRRFFAQAWDVMSFWPRRYHPFAVRPYSYIAVPELRTHINRLTDDGQGLVITAHSQGSVLAVTALATIDRSCCDRIALVTFGSPVAGLFRRAFSDHFSAPNLATLVAKLGGAGPSQRWDNFYRLTDPIGRPMFGSVPGAESGDRRLADPATQPQRSPDADRAPPRERDREPFTALAIHSYYRNERDLKDTVLGRKEALRGGDG